MNKLLIQTSDASVQAICKKDPVLKKLINVIGDIEINLRKDYFKSLIRSIIGQQISVAAASTIYERFEALFEGEMTPQKLLAISEADLRAVGLTKRKAEYVKDLATKVNASELDLENIAKYSNEEIMKQLTNVKGIGKWTAEMFLILTLGREDVLAIDDVGIQRAAKWLYEVDTSKRRDILVEKSDLWKPNRSIASFYLWEALHLDFIAQYNSIDDIK